MNIANINGINGEVIATKYLDKKSYDILALNYRSFYGEIDIIAQKDEYVVFVEVKTRSDNAFFTPKEAVTKTKQQKIISTAMKYLSSTQTFLQPRFDVIEIYMPKNPFLKPKVNHILIYIVIRFANALMKEYR